MKKLFFIVLLLSFTGFCHAHETCIVQWDPPEQIIAYHAVYLSTSNIDSGIIYCTVAGNVCSATLANLDEHVDKYYIKVKAYDDQGRPSDFSNEIEIDFCAGDFNQNGEVDYGDLMKFLDEYGRSNCPCP